jgi:hypothetical protein
MSCCGASRAQNKSGPDVGTLQPFPITTHQPRPRPLITPFGEKEPFHPPSISSPPPVQSLSRLNGAHSPPQSSTTHGSIPPSSPPPTVGTFNRSTVVDTPGSLSPLRRPSPAYPPAGNLNLLSTYQSSAPMSSSLPPTDEGKMSISIDFGERRSPLNIRAHACAAKH